MPGSVASGTLCTKPVSLDDPVDTAFNFFSCQIKPLLLRTSIVSALLSLAHIRRAKAKHPYSFLDT
jgi:hypothetical protein